MKLLANPIVLRMAGAAIVAFIVMVLFVWMMKRLRSNITRHSAKDFRPTVTSSADFTLAAYQGVIQRYKEQEKELARLRDEERLRAATTEKVNTAVLSQLSSGVLLFNALSLVQQANPAAKMIFGYASPLGFHARDLFKGIGGVRSKATVTAGEGSSPLLQALQRCIQSGEGAQRLEADYVTPQNQKRVLGITLSPVRNPQGQALGAACLVSDLTEITELARQVRLRENLASLGEMSAGIAHEFKNSLATISGYAQMLHGYREDAKTVQQFAGKIAEETAGLTRVVTDFLNFARPQSIDGIAAEGGGSQRETIALRPLFEDCARAYNCDLRVENVEENAAISGDPTALRQAFSNLLRNSSEAARTGERVMIEVFTERSEENMRIRLRDNGCGIPPKQLGKIFIPFFTTKTNGTGLGLALVHRIITQHGGAITVSSSDQGTEFIITLPVAAQNKAATNSEN